MTRFPLELGGAVCVAALACGPGVDEPVVSGSAETGVDVTTMGSQGSATSIPTAGDSGSGASAGETTGENPLDCTYWGDICGEFLVCDCSCDYSSDCCYCERAMCTVDAHCAAGEVCLDVAVFSSIELACIPGACAGSSMRGANVMNLRDAIYYENDVCLSSLSIDESGLADLATFTNLEYVHYELGIRSNAALGVLDGLESVQAVGTLQVSGNPVLTSVAGLGGLQRIREGGGIRNNPALPAGDVHALLAGIEGGDAVEVCGNLDDVGC